MLFNRLQKIKTMLILGFFLQLNLIAKDNIEKTADILQGLIPAIGYGATWYLDDEDGRYDFYKSFVTNTILTHVIKYTVNKERPYGGKHSFPSGHTSSAFQGATFIHKRYGWEYAIAPYIAATFVAYSRVHANKHYVSDVIAGAALGMASSWFLTTEYKGYTIMPTVDTGMVGVSIRKKW